MFVDAAFCFLTILGTTQHGELHLKISSKSKHNYVDVILQFGTTHKYHLSGELPAKLRRTYKQMQHLKMYGDYHTFGKNC